MRTGTAGAWLFAVGVGLAGCAGSPPSISDAPAGPGSIGEGASVIAGTVTDDSLSPVAYATVTLDGRFSASTDAGGAFAFRGVAAGDHEVRVSMDGFEAAAATVRVAVDEEAEIAIVLQRIPGTAPYADVFVQQGFLGCGVALRAPVGGQPSVAACGPLYLAGLSQFEQYALTWTPNPLHGSTGFIGETHWEPNQASAAAMRTEWTHWMVGQNAYQFDQATGTSPLWVRVPMENMTRVLADAGDPETCTMDECFINSLHWTHAGTLGPSYPVDATVMFQQRYEDLLTVFYNQPLPVEYTALPDA